MAVASDLICDGNVFFSHLKTITNYKRNDAELKRLCYRLILPGTVDKNDWFITCRHRQECVLFTKYRIN